MKRTTTLLAALASATLLLAACSSTTSEEPPPTAESPTDQGADDGANGGSSSGVDDVPASGEADQATQDYLDCLLDHGVDAIIDGEGNIALGAGDQGSVSAGDTTSTTDEAQAECQKAVPEYAAPNDDEK